jgi:hypothetical protein
MVAEFAGLRRVCGFVACFLDSLPFLFLNRSRPCLHVAGSVAGEEDSRHGNTYKDRVCEVPSAFCGQGKAHSVLSWSMNENASALGKLGKDKKKSFSVEHRERLRKDGLERLLRWHEKQGHKIKKESRWQEKRFLLLYRQMSIKIQVQNLTENEEVALANCRETGRIICRLGKNLYRVLWQGNQIDMPRNQLGVLRNGRWVFGPVK